MGEGSRKGWFEAFVLHLEQRSEKKDTRPTPRQHQAPCFASDSVRKIAPMPIVEPSTNPSPLLVISPGDQIPSPRIRRADPGPAAGGTPGGVHTRGVRPLGFAGLPQRTLRSVLGGGHARHAGCSALGWRKQGRRE